MPIGVSPRQTGSHTSFTDFLMSFYTAMLGLISMLAETAPSVSLATPDDITGCFPPLQEQEKTTSEKPPPIFRWGKISSALPYSVHEQRDLRRELAVYADREKRTQ